MIINSVWIKLSTNHVLAICSNVTFSGIRPTHLLYRALIMLLKRRSFIVCYPAKSYIRHRRPPRHSGSVVVHHNRYRNVLKKTSEVSSNICLPKPNNQKPNPKHIFGHSSYSRSNSSRLKIKICIKITDTLIKGTRS